METLGNIGILGISGQFTFGMAAAETLACGRVLPAPVTADAPT